MAAPRAEKGRSDLNTGRWRRIESLCHAALARPAEGRTAFLADACRGDDALREEVESLVAEVDGAGLFLELPVVGGAVSPSLVGRQLGPYRIEGPIGAGGMGEVYHAKDIRLDRNVAIKVLPPHWTADPQRRTRFEREARAVAALKHPNICTIYDIGHDDGIDFLVMELVEGESLATRLSRGPLPCGEAVARAIEIANALDEAHRQGIIHRDLKPGNVMLTRSGAGASRGAEAKLLDFGLARIISSDMRAQLSPGPDTPMTEAGGLFGTVEYMAPEQIHGAPTDGRTDLFAFGALLYEMLTGRMAFGRATKAESLTAVLRDHPDQTVLERSDAAPSLSRIVRRCLEKDPADRFQTARDLAFALESAASPDRPETRSAEEGTIARARRIPLRRAIYVASAMTALAAMAVWTVRTRDVTPPNRDITQFTWSLPAGMTLGSEPVVSPDGRRVVFAGVGQSDSRLFVRDLATLEATPLPGTTRAKQPFWSPDGNAVAFFANGRLMKMMLDGEPVDLAAAPDARGGSWSRSGVIVFQPFFRDRGLARVSAQGGEVHAATVLDVTTDDTTHKWPVFLPDGDHFLYLVLSVDEKRRGIYVGSLSHEPSRPTTRLFPTGSSVSYVVPEGHDTGFLLSVADGQIQARPFDPARRTVTGDPRSIGIAAPETSVHYAAMMGVSPRLLAVADTVVPAGSQFASVGVDGRQLTLRPDREIAGAPRLSPDGARLTRSILDPLTGDADIWVDDLVRHTRVRISTSRDLDLAAVWSPDGRRLAYRSGPWGASNLSIASADGTGVLRVLRCPGEPCLPTDWSPDGRFALINVQGDVWSVQLGGDGSARPLLDAAFVQRDARISPDGRWVSYVSHESGRPEVYVRNLKGAPDRVVVSRGGDQPAWSRLGRGLFFVSLDYELHRVAVGTDRDGRVVVEPPVRLPIPTFAPGHLGTSYDVSPDAARVYFPHPAAPSKPRELRLALDWTARLK